MSVVEKLKADAFDLILEKERLEIMKNNVIERINILLNQIKEETEKCQKIKTDGKSIKS